MVDKYPNFSIVIPTFFRPGPLRNCLKALAVMDYPRTRYEVIVINDGAPFMQTKDLIPLGASMTLRVFNQSNRGPASARNMGASRALGEAIAFTDDDCAPSPKWLKSLVGGLTQGDQCAAGGRTVNQLQDNAYAIASQMMVDYLYCVMNESSEKARFLASNNLAVPKDRFMAMGGFDTGFTRAAGEDRDFCRRWVQRGYGMVYVSDAVVFHAHDFGFPGYLRQHFNYGRGALRYHRGKTGRSLKKIKSLLFYIGLLRFPLDRLGIGKRYRLALLMALSQVATTAGFLAGIRGPKGTTSILKR